VLCVKYRDWLLKQCLLTSTGVSLDSNLIPTKLLFQKPFKTLPVRLFSVSGSRSTITSCTGMIYGGVKVLGCGEIIGEIGTFKGTSALSPADACGGSIAKRGRLPKRRHLCTKTPISDTLGSVPSRAAGTLQWYLILKACALTAEP
jgi:hypothetical protein